MLGPSGRRARDRIGSTIVRAAALRQGGSTDGSTAKRAELRERRGGAPVPSHHSPYCVPPPLLHPFFSIHQQAGQTGRI